mmetsp:Transcript_9419/g.29940  ORF Transcript_9419/g.29940 Transcript_9419/m.29940 type:complete len:213 (-) Transcript_9419:206-844(-)
MAENKAVPHRALAHHAHRGFARGLQLEALEGLQHRPGAEGRGQILQRDTRDGPRHRDGRAPDRGAQGPHDAAEEDAADRPHAAAGPDLPVHRGPGLPLSLLPAAAVKRRGQPGPADLSGRRRLRDVCLSGRAGAGGRRPRGRRLQRGPDDDGARRPRPPLRVRLRLRPRRGLGLRPAHRPLQQPDRPEGGRPPVPAGAHQRERGVHCLFSRW